MFFVIVVKIFFATIIALLALKLFKRKNLPNKIQVNEKTGAYKSAIAFLRSNKLDGKVFSEKLIM